MHPLKLLHIDDLHAGYGHSQVLQGVALSIAAGEIVALLGRNGAGRSTLAKAIMGLLPAQGHITWRGQPLLGKKTYEIARLGLGYVPESRDVFPDLTVLQNLLLGQKNNSQPSRWQANGIIGQPSRWQANGIIGQPSRWQVDDMFALFPQLKRRAAVRAGVLSGGEQQMLTLSRTLMGDPALIIIDEPTEGLAPQLIDAVAGFLKALRARGIAVLLIEQKLTIALDVADRCAVMGHGRIVFDGPPDALRQNSALRQQWLQV